VRLPVALTIAGSDSGGGAGIQADLKTFHSLGVHGTCAITSITAQNTRGVTDRLDLPAGMVASQLQAVLSDLVVDAAKTGMLASPPIVSVVAEALSEYSVGRLVVDPVAYSSIGYPLLDEGGLEAIVEELLPRATVFTPNLAEASALLGRPIWDREDMREAACSLKKLGPASVVLKGGHLETGDEAVDVFYDGESLVELSLPRIKTVNNHGTGCVFSAAIAAYLALGEEPLEAVSRAKRDVARALENSLDIGGGIGPVYPFPEKWKR
jgi:hydroxymethylpyrimidine/phosphomethylpyrimidine kinase